MQPTIIRGLQVDYHDRRRAHQSDGDIIAVLHVRPSKLVPGIRTRCGDSNGFRVERLRVYKGGEFFGKVFQGYCLQMKVSLE